MFTQYKVWVGLQYTSISSCLLNTRFGLGLQYTSISSCLLNTRFGLGLQYTSLQYTRLYINVFRFLGSA